MNWDAIGAIAELVGALAVVITLAFLGAQLRANSAQVKNSTMQAQAAAMTSWAQHLATHPELHAIYQKGLRGREELSPEERGRFDLVLVQVFQSVAAIHRQFLNGGMDEETWLANLRTMSATIETPGGRESWERQKSMLDRRFQEEVERHFA